MINGQEARELYAQLRRLLNETTALSGPTQERPLAPRSGASYFDTTLGKPTWWSGSRWVDATGAGAGNVLVATEGPDGMTAAGSIA